MSKNLPSDQSETIMLVDDDDCVLRVVDQILEHDGYRVLQAHNAKAALEAGARHDCEIRLLLTEVVLPGMPGWQLAELMKLDYPKLKVLYISDGLEDPEDDIQELNDPSELILRKPFRADELLRAVRMALGGLLSRWTLGLRNRAAQVRRTNNAQP